MFWLWVQFIPGVPHTMTFSLASMVCFSNCLHSCSCMALCRPITGGNTSLRTLNMLHLITYIMLLLRGEHFSCPCQTALTFHILSRWSLSPPVQSCLCSACEQSRVVLGNISPRTENVMASWSSDRLESVRCGHAGDRKREMLTFRRLTLSSVQQCYVSTLTLGLMFFGELSYSPRFLLYSSHR